MNVWTLGMTIVSTVIIGFGVYGWLEERRWRRDHTPCQCATCRRYQWPAETDGLDFPDWVNDHDWDLAAKLELYDKDQP